MELGELTPEDFDRLSREVAAASRQLVEKKALRILDKAFDPRYTKREGLVDLFKDETKETKMSHPQGSVEREPAFVAVGNKLDIAVNLASELSLILNNIENKLFGPPVNTPPPQPAEKSATIDRGEDFVLLSYTNFIDRLHDELREAQRIASNIQEELP